MSAERMTAARLEPHFRITKFRTQDTARLAQMADDMGDACPPLLREAVNRLLDGERDKRTIIRLTDELNRYESRFGPLP